VKTLALIFAVLCRLAGCAPAFADPAVVLLPQATLSWNASADAGVVGYNLYYGNAPSSYQNEIPGGTNLSTTVTGLVFGLTYYFAVTAADVCGNESDFSNEIFFTAAPQTMELRFDVPADGHQLPTNFTFSFLQSSTDLVNWSACEAELVSNACEVSIDTDVPAVFYRAGGILSP
jgi:hypothetical protein